MELEDYYKLPILPQPSTWLTKLLNLQAELIYNCFSPIFSLFPFSSNTYHCVGATKDCPDTVVHHTTAAGTAVSAFVPAAVVQGGGLFMRKIVAGLLGATYMFIVLVVVMVAAVMLGVCFVQFEVEEPVILRERLYFDYAEVHPNAVLVIRGYGGAEKKMGVPVGHMIYASLVLLMPESDYNREIGNFQLLAEVISAEGNVIDKSSHPCMLRFRSLPLRLMRTSLLSVPLLLGITSETQRLTIPLLRHKERYPRTEAIRITLIPRAGTSLLPQLYEAEIIVNSELPWRKAFVCRWKWTFYVWTSVCMYILLLMVLICCFRPLIFPVITTSVNHNGKYDRDTSVGSPGELSEGSKDSREISEMLAKWKESGRKRRVMVAGISPGTISSSASSISVSRGDSSSTDEDAGDSECFHDRVI